jgi:hypothetical protein
MPSSVRTPSVVAALVMLALAWLLWVRTQHRPPAWQLAWWLFALLLAMSMQRTVAVAALMALPLLCTTAEAAASRRPRRASMIPMWLLAGATSVGITLAAPVAAATATQPLGVPSKLGTELRSLPTGTRMLVNGDTSGWVLYAAPHVQPIYDIRVESFTPHQVKDYIRIMSAEPGWRELLDRSGARAALVLADAPVRAALTEQAGWSEVGTDAGLVLLKAPR